MANHKAAWWMSRESSIDQPQGSLMADVTCIATRWRRGFLCEGRNGCIRPWMKRLEYFLSPSGLFDIDDPLQGLGRESCISPPPCTHSHAVKGWHRTGRIHWRGTGLNRHPEGRD